PRLCSCSTSDNALGVKLHLAVGVRHDRTGFTLMPISVHFSGTPRYPVIYILDTRSKQVHNAIHRWETLVQARKERYWPSSCLLLGGSHAFSREAYDTRLRYSDAGRTLDALGPRGDPQSTHGWWYHGHAMRIPARCRCHGATLASYPADTLSH